MGAAWARNVMCESAISEFYENGNDNSGSIQGAEFFHKLRDDLLHKIRTELCNSGIYETHLIKSLWKITQISD
jgi:hypothetical protein